MSDLLALPALEGAEVAGAADPVLEVVSLGGAAARPGVLLVDGPAPARLPEGCVAVVARSPAAEDPGVPVVVLADDASWGAALSQIGAGRRRSRGAGRRGRRP